MTRTRIFHAHMHNSAGSFSWTIPETRAHPPFATQQLCGGLAMRRSCHNTLCRLPQRGASDAGDPFPFEDYVRLSRRRSSGEWNGRLGMVGQMRKDSAGKKSSFWPGMAQIVQEVWQRRVPSDLSGISTHYLLASRRAPLHGRPFAHSIPRRWDFLTKPPSPDAAGGS